MTRRSGSVIVCVGNKKGSQIRRGEAMLKMYMQNRKTEYRPYDLQGIIMLSATKAEQLHDACLGKTGSGGHLTSDVRRYIAE